MAKDVEKPKCPMIVLHVEDDADIQEITKIALEMAGGFELHQCFTRQEAIEMASSLKADLLLLDVMLRTTSGTDLLRELRNLPTCASVPAIFMTARTRPEEQAEYISAGAVGLIEKPFDPLRLATQIKSIVDASV
mgnify:CR=1 FL=1